MASEILRVPEERIPDVIKVLRTGLGTALISFETRMCLMNWCNDMEQYMHQGDSDDA